MAQALEDLPRARAARRVGMERQALREAMVRNNAEGLRGLEDRPKPVRPPGLSEGEEAALSAAAAAQAAMVAATYHAGQHHPGAAAT